MAARLATVTEEEILKMNEEAMRANTKKPPVWVMLKQLSPPVSLPCDLDICCQPRVTSTSSKAPSGDS